VIQKNGLIRYQTTAAAQPPTQQKVLN